MSRVYFMGRVHGPPEVLSGIHPPFLVLSRSQLNEVTPLMIGRPITYSHAGYKEAMWRSHMDDSERRIPSFNHVDHHLTAMAEEHPIYTIAGRIVDYFGVPNGGYYIVFYVTDPVMTKMIMNRWTSSLSMTHHKVPEVDFIEPYEVTLCAVPRRFGSFVFVTGTLEAMTMYKSWLISGYVQEPKMASEAPPVASVATPSFEEAVRGLPPTIAGVVAAGIEREMMARRDAEAKYKQLQKESSHESSLLAHHITNLQGLLSEEMRDLYGLNIDSTALASSTNPDVIRNLAGNLVAASVQTLRQLRAERLGGTPDAPDTRKRARTDIPNMDAVAAGVSAYQPSAPKDDPNDRLLAFARGWAEST